MNIFWLDTNIERCVQYHCDKHVVKMLVEYTQLLSASSRMSGLEQGYRLSHAHHPCTLWLMESVANWEYLYKLASSLSDEYTYRYDKVHASSRVLKTLETPYLPNRNITSPPQCMPDDCICQNFVLAYRLYYIMYKNEFARWTGRKPPEWFIEGIERENRKSFYNKFNN